MAVWPEIISIEYKMAAQKDDIRESLPPQRCSIRQSFPETSLMFVFILSYKGPCTSRSKQSWRYVGLGGSCFVQGSFDGDIWLGLFTGKGRMYCMTVIEWMYKTMKNKPKGVAYYHQTLRQ